MPTYSATGHHRLQNEPSPGVFALLEAIEQLEETVPGPDRNASIDHKRPGGGSKQSTPRRALVEDRATRSSSLEAFCFLNQDMRRDLECFGDSDDRTERRGLEASLDLRDIRRVHVAFIGEHFLGQPSSRPTVAYSPPEALLQRSPAAHTANPAIYGTIGLETKDLVA